MALARRFEELIVWQRARALAGAVYQLIQAAALSRDNGFVRQLQRAAVSIMSNIAEGFERRSAAVFRRYLMISLGSCAELRSQLYLAMDIGLVSDSSHQELHEQSQEVARLLAALRRSIRKENDGMS